LKNRFAELPVIPTPNNIWHLLPESELKICDPLLSLLNIMFVIFDAHTNVCSHFMQWNWLKTKSAHVLLISTWVDMWFCLQLIFNLTLRNWLLLFSHN